MHPGFLIIPPEPSLVHRSQIILVQIRNLTAETPRTQRTHRRKSKRHFGSGLEISLNLKGYTLRVAGQEDRGGRLASMHLGS